MERKGEKKVKIILRFLVQAIEEMVISLSWAIVIENRFGFADMWFRIYLEWCGNPFW